MTRNRTGDIAPISVKHTDVQTQNRTNGPSLNKLQINNSDSKEHLTVAFIEMINNDGFGSCESGKKNQSNLMLVENIKLF